MCVCVRACVVVVVMVVVVVVVVVVGGSHACVLALLNETEHPRPICEQPGS